MLAQDYKEKILTKLASEMGLKSHMAMPRLEKVVVNLGIGELKDDKEARERLIVEVSQITGQKPALRQARQSVASFGVRKGQPVGLTTTLRGKRMYAFLEKLFNVVLPRLRDFKGLSQESFDEEGNYTLGITEHTVFPEVDLGKVGKVKGLEITLVTNTKDKQKSKRLLEALGMPLEKEGLWLKKRK